MSPPVDYLKKALLTYVVCRLSYAEDVEVLVGPGGQQFSIPKSLLVERSYFFKTALSERWLQEGSKAIKLPEADPQIFDMYLNCIYKSAVNVGDVTEAINDAEFAGLNNPNCRSCARLFNLWMLADKLGDVMATNMIMDAIIDLAEMTKRLPGALNLAMAYSRTTDSSLLRKYLIDAYVFETWAEEFEEEAMEASFPPTLLRDITIKDAHLKKIHRDERYDDVCNANSTIKHRCLYRQHDELHRCCGTDCEKAKVTD